MWDSAFPDVSKISTRSQHSVRRRRWEERQLIKMVTKNHVRKIIYNVKLDFKKPAARLDCATTYGVIRPLDFIFITTYGVARLLKVNIKRNNILNLIL